MFQCFVCLVSAFSFLFRSGGWIFVSDGSNAEKLNVSFFLFFYFDFFYFQKSRISLCYGVPYVVSMFFTFYFVSL